MIQGYGRRSVGRVFEPTTNRPCLHPNDASGKGNINCHHRSDSGGCWRRRCCSPPSSSSWSPAAPAPTASVPTHGRGTQGGVGRGARCSLLPAPAPRSSAHPTCVRTPPCVVDLPANTHRLIRLRIHPHTGPTHLLVRPRSTTIVPMPLLPPPPSPPPPLLPAAPTRRRRWRRTGQRGSRDEQQP